MVVIDVIVSLPGIGFIIGIIVVVVSVAIVVFAVVVGVRAFLDVVVSVGTASS